MYDIVVIGQGLTGLLSAIWAKDDHNKVALISSGTGKIIQSTGVMELYTECDHKDAMVAIDQFKLLMEKLECEYFGNIDNHVSIVTGSGHIKETMLYPGTITPIADQASVVIVGFKELPDFKPEYMKGNLIKDRPQLKADTLNISLGKKSQRTMTQLDAARLLEEKDTRTYVIKQIKDNMKDLQIPQPSLFIFPASLGVEKWKEVSEHLRDSLGSQVTEAPGMPPNATAIRLFETLKKEAIKRGIRFYSDTQVIAGTLSENELTSVTIKNSSRTSIVKGRHYINATGGVLGGGLEVTVDGLVDKVFSLEVNPFGKYMTCPKNLFPVGASEGVHVTNYGITGAVYSILKSYHTIFGTVKGIERGVQHV